MFDLRTLTIPADAYVSAHFDAAYDAVSDEVGHRPAMRITRPVGSVGPVGHFVVTTTAEDVDAVAAIIGALC